jgi:hypothetical protein
MSVLRSVARLGCPTCHLRLCERTPRHGRHQHHYPEPVQVRRPNGGARVAFGGTAALMAAVWCGWMTSRGSAVPPVLALGVLGIGACLINPASTSGLVLPAVFLTYRIGPGAINMSIADLLLLCSIPVSVVGLRHLTRTQEHVLKLIASYEALLLLPVVAHPTTVAIVEWLHRGAIMAGGIVIGTAIARFGGTRYAVRSLMVTGAVFATAAIVGAVSNGFQPVYPLGIHKNAAGGLLAMLITLLATGPLDRMVAPLVRFPLYALLSVGLLATRSRGPMVALGAVMFLVAARRLRRGGRRLVLRYTAVTLIAGSAFFLVAIRSAQDEQKADVFRHGPIATRQKQHDKAYDVFTDHMLFGAGIRYFKTAEYAGHEQPSSVIYETSAEAGVIGLLALAFLVGGTTVTLIKMRGPLAASALALFGVKAIHGLVDLFWVAGPFTLPWLIIGIAAATEGDASPPAEPQLEELHV